MAASTAPCGARGAKKRKVSSAKDNHETEPPKEPQATDSEQQQQANIKDEASMHDEKKAVAKAGKIPRLQQKSKQLLKPVTPSKFSVFISPSHLSRDHITVRMLFSSKIYLSIIFVMYLFCRLQKTP